MGASFSSSSSKKSGRRHRLRVSAEINITPLVDVMLVLLVVFMVTAPMMTGSVPVDLPKTSAAAPSDESTPVVVSVDAQGRCYLEETPVSDTALTNRLLELTEKNQETRIYVRGDQSLSYGRVMEVMGEISSAGFTRVSLMAEVPPGKSAGPPLPSSSSETGQSTQKSSPKAP